MKNPKPSVTFMSVGNTLHKVDLDTGEVLLSTTLNNREYADRPDLMTPQHMLDEKSLYAQDGRRLIFTSQISELDRLDSFYTKHFSFPTMLEPQEVYIIKHISQLLPTNGWRNILIVERETLYEAMKLVGKRKYRDCLNRLTKLSDKGYLRWYGEEHGIDKKLLKIVLHPYIGFYYNASAMSITNPDTYYIFKDRPPYSTSKSMSPTSSSGGTSFSAAFSSTINSYYTTP